MEVLMAYRRVAVMSSNGLQALSVVKLNGTGSHAIVLDLLVSERKRQREGTIEPCTRASSESVIVVFVNGIQKKSITTALIPFCFKPQAPVNYVCLHSVEPSLRPLSMAISTVSIHIFGDVPSSPLVGVLQDYVNNWRLTALVLTSVLFISAGIWFVGVFLNTVDKYGEGSGEEVPATVKPTREPLLAGINEMPDSEV